MKKASLMLLVLTPTAFAWAQDQTDAILFAARETMVRQNDAWFHDGDFLPVIQNQDIITGVFPTDEESWSNLAWMYSNIQRPDLQWVTGKRFAENNPTYKDAVYYQAELFFVRKLYAKVPGLLEPVIGNSPPPDANAFRFLAHSYDKMGYYEDALRVWNTYLKIKPDDGAAKVNRDKVAKKLANPR